MSPAQSLSTYRPANADRSRFSLPASEVTATDYELVRCLLSGDPGAQRQFVTRFQRTIYKVLNSLHLSEQDKEDLFQQVFVHLWEGNCRRLRMWQGRGQGQFHFYLRKVVTHLVYDHTRMQAPCVGLMDLAPDDEPRASVDLEQMLFRREQKDALDATLKRLSPRDRALILRKHREGQSYKEIAQALGMSVGHVGVALSRAEARLRQRLCELYPDLFDFRW